MTLNDYQRANLHWLLKNCKRMFPGLDTGDWLGELLLGTADAGNGNVDDAELDRAIERSFKGVRIWHFSEAPPEYQALSRHGGDEDFVAHVPESDIAVMWWLEYGPWNEASRHKLPDGSLVLISAHA